MAQSVKSITNLKSNIQSRAQQAVTEMQQKTASSTAATQAGSTATPTVTEAPKVTPTAKAVPSVSKPDITPTVPTVNAKDLLGTKTTPTLSKASQDLLSPATEKKDIQKTTIPLNMVRAASNMGGQAEQVVNESLYNQGLDWINEKMGKLEETRKDVTEKVGSTAIDLFKGVGQDISTQWSSGEGIGMVRDFVANTAEGLPRGITRVEYGLAELLDRASDAKWVEDLKSNIESNLDYWENTRVYKKVSETSSFKDFLKNPGMYAGGTFTEMLPMFISPWVAVPTTFAQMYGDAYKDYANDESLQDLTDNQIRLMATGVAGVNTIIELGADLIQGIMPWTKTVAKGTEREVRRMLSKPISNLVKKIVKGGASEGIEEVLQNEIQTQVAIAGGSDRPAPTWGERFTLGLISASIGGIFGGGDFTVNLGRSKELQLAFNEWSEAVDKIAPGVSKSDKEKLFSAIVAAEIEDANMSEDLVNKYEAQTTELYNRIDELNAELETTTNEDRKQEINRQIEDANQRIKNIDEIINKGNAIMEEVNQKLQELSQQETEELLAPKEEAQQLPRENGEENLSAQTMREEYVEPQKIEKMPETREEFDSLYEELRKPNRPILRDMNYEELASYIKKVFQKYKDARIAGDYDMVSNTKFIFKALFEELNLKRDEYRREKSKSVKAKNARDYIRQMEDLVEKANGLWDFYDKDSKTNIGNQYMSQFIMSPLEGDFAKHLPGLKGIDLKQLEGKLTEENIKKISEMLALVSKTFGIDFNKVIKDKNFSMNVAEKMENFIYNTHTLGKMSWRGTKEQIEELMKKTGDELSPGEEILRTGVIITLNGNVREAAATMAHELWHLIDVAISTEEGLPLYYEGDRMNFRSIIDREDWDTFRYGNAKPGSEDYKYYTRPTEILARYAEQYYLYVNDEQLFDIFAGTEDRKGRDWYWSKEEFENLLPRFEALITERVGDKMLDIGNEEYYDTMRKLNDYRYNNILLSDKQLLDEIKRGNPEMQNDAAVKMLQMQKDYIELSRDLDNLKGDISDEIRAEYATELDNLATNIGLLEQTMQDYMVFTEKKIPLDIIESADVALREENLQEDQQQIEDEDTSFEEQTDMQDEMDDQIDAAGGIQNVNEWQTKKIEYEKEKGTQKKQEIRRNLVESRDGIWDVAKDILTPTMSRIYNINRRIAGRLHQMEAQSGINIYRYTQKCQGFVDHMNSLKGEAKLEVTDALLNYGALASEQTEDTIADYKKQEVAKLKEVLLRNGFKEKDINDMFSTLNDLGTRYKEAGLSINLSDMYFPRVVKDYNGLIEYMSRVSGTKIEDKTKNVLMRNIQDIIDNPSYSDAEKEKLIRNKLTFQFPQTIKPKSKHAEERKLGLLSERGAGVYAYYEDPTISLAHYITTMEYAIQRQLFLGGQAKDLGLDIDTVSSSNEQSVSAITQGLVERGEINSNQVNELQKCIIAVMDKKSTPRWIQRMKDLTYTMALTNYISAINQMEDIGVAIIENKGGLISTVKAIFSKAGIKYDESGLESAYEMFKSDIGISNKLFAASGFNFTDRLGKKCFLNAAWTSMVKRAKNSRSKKYLVDRLTAMYGEKTAEHIMEKVESGSYKDNNGQIDIDVLTDLLYQLGTTQPIYTSAMPVAYLRSPKARWFYALSMFSIRQVDHIIQSTKQTYQERGAAAAAVQAFWFISMRMFFGALVGDIGDWLQGKGEEETWLGQWISEGADVAGQKFLEDYLKAFSKLWMFSDYDKDTFKKDGIWGVVANKMYPYLLQEAHKLRKSTERAFKNEDPTELVPMLRDVPLIGKQVAAWWNHFLKEEAASVRPASNKTGRPKASGNKRPTSSSKNRPTS